MPLFEITRCLWLCSLAEQKVNEARERHAFHYSIQPLLLPILVLRHRWGGRGYGALKLQRGQRRKVAHPVLDSPQAALPAISRGGPGVRCERSLSLSMLLVRLAPRPVPRFGPRLFRRLSRFDKN